MTFAHIVALFAFRGHMTSVTLHLKIYEFEILLKMTTILDKKKDKERMCPWDADAPVGPK